MAPVTESVLVVQRFRSKRPSVFSVVLTKPKARDALGLCGAPKDCPQSGCQKYLSNSRVGQC